MDPDSLLLPSSSPSSSSSSLSSSSANSNVVNKHMPLHLTPPVSPSPFMKDFLSATSLPPTSAHSAYPTTMSSRLWKKQKSLRRWWMLAALPTALIIFVTAAVTLRGNSLITSTSTSRIILDDIPMARQRHGGGEWRHRRRINEADVWRRAEETTDAADEDPVLSLGEIGSSPSSSSATPTSSLSLDLSDSDLTATATTTSTLTVAPAVPSNPVLPTPFVQPFDETLGTDFISGTCQIFLSNLTTILEFRQCRPFSLLLPTSQGFLTAESNLTLLTAIVYGTCTTTPTEDECIDRMNGYQTQIQQECSQELAAGHADVWDAFNGFKNYKLYREAACLRNARTNSYCFVDAVAANPPSDIYFYQLPLGTPLPGTTVSTSSAASASATAGTTTVSITPTCSACTQSLMTVFAEYASNSSLLISKTYPAAQALVDKSDTCGNGYAAAVGAAMAGTRLAWGWATPIVVVLLWSLL